MSQEPTELGQNPGGPSEAGPHCLSHAVPCGCGSPSAREGTCLPCLAAGRGGQPLAGLCSSPELRAHLLPPPHTAFCTGAHGGAAGSGNGDIMVWWHSWGS